MMNSMTHLTFLVVLMEKKNLDPKSEEYGVILCG